MRSETAGGCQRPRRSGRRQLLILALFSAIVAHFVEVHFGIAIASTLTLFWVLAGPLVAVGMGWVEDEDQAEVEAKVEAARPRRDQGAAGRGEAQPAAAAGKQKSGKAARSPRRAPDAGAQTARRSAGPAAGAAARSPVPAPALRRDRRLDHAGAHLGFPPAGRPRAQPARGPSFGTPSPARWNASAYEVVQLADAAGDVDLHLADGRSVGVAESARRQRWAAGLAVYLGATVGASWSTA